MIHRFDLLMVSQWSCMFLSCFLSIFSLSLSHWCTSSSLCLIADILFSTWSILLTDINTTFNSVFYLSYWDFHFQDFNLLIFSFMSCLTFLVIQLFICILFEFIQMLIHVLLKFGNYSYHCSFYLIAWNFIYTDRGEQRDLFTLPLVSMVTILFCSSLCGGDDCRCFMIGGLDLGTQFRLSSSTSHDAFSSSRSQWFQPLPNISPSYARSNYGIQAIWAVGSDHPDSQLTQPGCGLWKPNTMIVTGSVLCLHSRVRQ
jgi:hypothetical protein